MKTSLLILSFVGIISLQTCSTDDEPAQNCQQLMEEYNQIVSNYTYITTSEQGCIEFYNAWKNFVECALNSSDPHLANAANAAIQAYGQTGYTVDEIYNMGVNSCSNLAD